MNPYNPPANDSPDESNTRTCPDCGAAMVPGDVTGSAFWMEKGASRLRRFVSRGDALIGGTFRITLKTPRATGFRCGNCGLLMIRRNR